MAWHQSHHISHVIFVCLFYSSFFHILFQKKNVSSTINCVHSLSQSQHPSIIHMIYQLSHIKLSWKIYYFHISSQIFFLLLIRIREGVINVALNDVWILWLLKLITNDYHHRDFTHSLSLFLPVNYLIELRLMMFIFLCTKFSSRFIANQLSIIKSKSCRYFQVN